MMAACFQRGSNFRTRWRREAIPGFGGGIGVQLRAQFGCLGPLHNSGNQHSRNSESTQGVQHWQHTLVHLQQAALRGDVQVFFGRLCHNQVLHPPLKGSKYECRQNFQYHKNERPTGKSKPCSWLQVLFRPFNLRRLKHYRPIFNTIRPCLKILKLPDRLWAMVHIIGNRHV